MKMSIDEFKKFLQEKEKLEKELKNDIESDKKLNEIEKIRLITLLDLSDEFDEV